MVQNVVESSADSYDTAVAGVVSAQPGIALGEKGAGKVLVAQSGRVRVKVDASYGAIRAGDLLVTSPTPGYAMRSQSVDVGGVQIHRPGTVLEKLLEHSPRKRARFWFSSPCSKEDRMSAPIQYRPPSQRLGALLGLAGLIFLASPRSAGAELPSTCTFTDQPLTAAVSIVKAVHLTELRACISDLRTQSSLSAFSWTDGTLVPHVTSARAAHINDFTIRTQ